MEKAYGQPSWTKEYCEKCGTEWERYRTGSHDWKYKNCFKCEHADTLDEALGVVEVDKFMKKMQGL